MKPFIVLSLLSLILVGCNATQNSTSPSASPTNSPAQSSQSSDRQAQGKPTVVTTVAPLTNIVSNIAGDRAEVRGIVPEGTDSHTFEPRPSDGELLKQADLIIANGLQLEAPTLKLAEAAKPRDAKIHEVGTSTIEQGEWIFDASFPKEGGKPNPHLWVNPKYAAAYARQAAEQLTALDPAGADYYATNLKNYLQRLDQLDQVTRKVVASIPPENRKLLTYHDSWAYWAREYDVDVIGAIQPSDFNEPSAQDVSKLIDQIRESKVPAIFGSEVFPSKVAEQIAREANVKLDNTSDDDLPGEGSANAMENNNPEHTYIGMMAENLRILARNLGGDPSLVDSLETANIVGPTATAQAKP
ncbi:MAG: metal ABC transporter substrate-binding protein [Trichocoleus desertorum ATA4-8-CV12]|jgi:manganese/iron transport system substrate-binding protein|nr:metal ABC transporter substrate-binding protein [Trichocoleus desertorum ATA4-8-CV12]